MQKIFVVGGVSYNAMIDLYDLPEPRPQTIFAQGWHTAIGSTGAGKALNLAKLGFEVTLHALLGDDDAGQKIRDIIQATDITFLPEHDPAGTKQHVNLMARSGERISIHVETGSFEPNINLTRLEPVIAASDMIALSIINYCRQLIPLAQKHNKPLWVDIHDYDGTNPYHQDFIDAADVLFMSGDAMPDPRPFMEAQIAAGKQMIVCTHGKDGATALCADGHWLETPIVEGYTFKDSNGAGDAFFSGVAYAYAHGYPISASLQMGAVVAGLCITTQGLVYPELTPALAGAEFLRAFP